MAVLGNPGPRHRGARRVARRPRADQLSALLGGGDEAARDQWPGSRRAVPVPCRRPPRAAAGYRGARRPRRGRGDRLHGRPVSSRDRLRRSPGARTGPRSGRARPCPSDDRRGHRATRCRRLRRLRPHCVEAKSDARDAGVVFRYLRGELSGRIVDMAYTDAAALYEAPDPTWVAAPLVEWRRG